MTPYKNLNRNSSVVAYELAENHIIIQFEKGQCTFYKYTVNSVGRSNLETMKKLAVQGYGLGSFIQSNEEVKNGYESKW